MLAEIITIGDEILIGQILDTNSAYISKELDKIGVRVYQITSIHDDRAHILQAFKDAKQKVDIVIVTGGLGPTKDDITKRCFCEFFEDILVESPQVAANIKNLLQRLDITNPSASNFNQAQIPSQATVLNNIHGTAPGMWMEADETVFISLPGVPYEMKHLMQSEVLPKLIKRFHRPFIYHKTLLTYGMGESNIAERISTWENALPENIRLAYLPSLGKVRLRLSSEGWNEQKLRMRVDSQMEELQNILEDIAIGFEDETNIVGRIAHILDKNKLTLSLAESCSGGAIAKEITSEAGVSTFFKGCVIPYATALKINILGVSAELIEKHSVVSIPVAESMAVQANLLFQSDYAIATTGIAGPTKGDGIDEVGTVCIALAYPGGVISEKFAFGNDRYRVIQKTTNKALEMILKEISKI